MTYSTLLRSGVRRWVRRAALFADHSLQTSDVATDPSEVVRLRSLAGGAGHAEIELFATQLQQLFLQVRGGFGAQFFSSAHVCLTQLSVSALGASRTACPPTAWMPRDGTL